MGKDTKQEAAKADAAPEADKPEDNNKDYQRLFAQEQELAAFLVDNSDEDLNGGAIPAAMRTIEKLVGNGATAGELAAIARAEAAEKRVAEIEALVAAGGNVAAPEAAAPAEPKERPKGARDVGPTFGVLERAELETLLDKGAKLELVFSNGDYEIVDFEPVKVTAKDLPAMAGKRQLANPVYVRGGDNDDRIAGAALLHKGEQVAYCGFPAPVEIEKGQERRFERVISFG